ncbi:hypothetical protein BV22DRAFT_1034753 [Leucogyrophana mollusca]|uniref:Uncharacterized protein n=1 Tax=Leucogyrophana mollusca TaxID=85980 RepID=A0ACB8BH29_9AGAM|nr:hypothetical protein BV22DRAFT_1034753 [Leucogyrophana mollusca]
MDFSAAQEPGWTACVHPEGALYFFHSEQRIYTDIDVRVEKKGEAIVSYAMRLREMFVTMKVPIEPDSELMIDLVKEKKKIKCEYYFVDHKRRCLFWAHAMETERLAGHVKGVIERSQLKYAMETQYWKHIEFYPHEREVSEKAFNELKDIVVHANAEAITSSTYLAPFDKEELAKMRDLLDSLQDGVNEKRPYFVCVIARMMRLFSNIRFFNFCGQPGARLDADQSVYEKSKIKDDKKSVLLRIMNIVLFGAPEVHINGLRRVWVDETVNHARWQDFTNNLYNEWNGFTIYSTVMLAVDVSFLAVPGVDPGNAQSQTLSTVATYLSTLNAVGSLVISLLLVGQSRKRGRESMEGAASFMSRMTKTRLRTETLGIMYSLPYALLMWGMVWFVVALSFTIFQSSEPVTLAATGIQWAIIAAFVVSPVWASKEGDIIEYWETWRAMWEERAAEHERRLQKRERRHAARNSHGQGDAGQAGKERCHDPERG